MTTPCIPENQSLHQPESGGYVSRADIREAVDLYNEIAENCDLPVARFMTPKRRAMLRRILQKYDGLDGWFFALEKVEASSFLTGNNDRGWRLSLDFMLNESKFVALIEGRYDDRPPGGGENE